MLNSYKNQKININIIFLILYFLKTVLTTSICDNKSPIYGLYLNTSFTQDYSNTNLSIISDCSIDKYWRVKTGKETNFHIHKVLEDESINRRILKFGYNASKLSKLKFSEKYIINLKYSILEGNGFISFGSQTYQNAKEKKAMNLFLNLN